VSGPVGASRSAPAAVRSQGASSPRTATRHPAATGSRGSKAERFVPSTVASSRPGVNPRCRAHTAPEASVELYWLPLGAGGHSVRLNGRVFEALAARLERRAPCDLYHSALEVRVSEGRFVIEQTPVPDSNGGERGVVAEGAVGSRRAGRFRIFR
jgi:hypothetical protein